MRRIITKVTIRFDLTSRTFVSWDRKVTRKSIYGGGTELVKHNLWRVTIKRSERHKVKNLIKALFLCTLESEVLLEKDGYSIYFVR